MRHRARSSGANEDADAGAGAQMDLPSAKKPKPSAAQSEVLADTDSIMAIKEAEEAFKGDVVHFVGIYVDDLPTLERVYAAGKKLYLAPLEMAPTCDFSGIFQGDDENSLIADEVFRSSAIERVEDSFNLLQKARQSNDENINELACSLQRWCLLLVQALDQVLNK